MDVPSLVVFDLDECVWSPEMYTLSQIPTDADKLMGDLGGSGEGVVGVRSGREVISIFPGALQAFQRLLDGEYGQCVRAAAASSADTPLAVKIGKRAMSLLEVLPGISLKDAFLKIGGGFGDERNLQIGRSPPLSSDKSATHFPILKKLTGIPYKEMLFFDDCNWTDHCTLVGQRCAGVVTQKTPNGMTLTLWEGGMRKFRESRCHQ